MIYPATLAQLVERLTRNEQVVGSNPTGGSSYCCFSLTLTTIGGRRR